MKTFKSAMSAICLLAALFLTSCTDEPKADNNFEPVKNGNVVRGEINLNILSRNEAALQDGTYTCDEHTLYRKDALTEGQWELDANEYEGGGWSIPNSIVVSDSKIWRPMTLFSSTFGPTAFATALRAVNKKLKKDYYVYAARPFSIDPEAYTLTLERNVFGIILADDEKLMLSHESEYMGGRTGTGGSFLEVGSYSRAEPLSFDDGKNLGFDSVVEAYDWLIDLFRATFGERVNLNELYYPNVILNEPYFYAAQLEKERDWIAENR